MTISSASSSGSADFVATRYSGESSLASDIRSGVPLDRAIRGDSGFRAGARHGAHHDRVSLSHTLARDVDRRVFLRPEVGGIRVPIDWVRGRRGSLIGTDRFGHVYRIERVGDPSTRATHEISLVSSVTRALGSVVAVAVGRSEHHAKHVAGVLYPAYLASKEK